MTSQVDNRHELYCMGVIYTHIIKMIHSGIYLQEVNEQLLRFSNFWLREMRRVNKQIPLKDKLEFACKDVEVEMLFSCMGLGKYEPDYSQALEIAKFQAFLQGNQKWIIYGAGYVGKLLLKYLRRIGKADGVIAFAVTKKTLQEEFCEGIPVKEIKELSEEYASQEEVTVVTAVRKELQEELLSNCQNCGFERVIVFEDVQQYYVRGYLEEMGRGQADV